MISGSSEVTRSLATMCYSSFADILNQFKGNEFKLRRDAIHNIRLLIPYDNDVAEWVGLHGDLNTSETKIRQETSKQSALCTSFEEAILTLSQIRNNMRIGRDLQDTDRLKLKEHVSKVNKCLDEFREACAANVLTTGRIVLMKLGNCGLLDHTLKQAQEDLKVKVQSRRQFRESYKNLEEEVKELRAKIAYSEKKADQVEKYLPSISKSIEDLESSIDSKLKEVEELDKVTTTEIKKLGEELASLTKENMDKGRSLRDQKAKHLETVQNLQLGLIEQVISSNSTATVVKETLVILVLDESGSMMINWGNLCSVADKFVSLLPQQAKICVILFDNEARVVIQPTCSRDIISNLPSVPHGGGTNYGRGLKLAQDIAAMNKSSRIITVFMTDGAANIYEAVEITKITKSLYPSSWFFGIGFGELISVLEPVVRSGNAGKISLSTSKGKVPLLVQATNVEQLVGAFESVASSISAVIANAQEKLSFIEQFKSSPTACLIDNPELENQIKRKKENIMSISNDQRNKLQKEVTELIKELDFKKNELDQKLKELSELKAEKEVIQEKLPNLQEELAKGIAECKKCEATLEEESLAARVQRIRELNPLGTMISKEQCVKLRDYLIDWIDLEENASQISTQFEQSALSLLGLLENTDRDLSHELDQLRQSRQGWKQVKIYYFERGIIGCEDDNYEAISRISTYLLGPTQIKNDGKWETAIRILCSSLLPQELLESETISAARTRTRNETGPLEKLRKMFEIEFREKEDGPTISMLENQIDEKKTDIDLGKKDIDDKINDITTRQEAELDEFDKIEDQVLEEEERELKELEDDEDLSESELRKKKRELKDKFERRARESKRKRSNLVESHKKVISNLESQNKKHEESIQREIRSLEREVNRMRNTMDQFFDKYLRKLYNLLYNAFTNILSEVNQQSISSSAARAVDEIIAKFLPHLLNIKTLSYQSTSALLSTNRSRDKDSVSIESSRPIITFSMQFGIENQMSEQKSVPMIEEL